MKKLIGLLVGIVLVLSLSAFAEKVPCSSGSDCKNQLNIVCSQEEIQQGGICKKDVDMGGSGSSFYLDVGHSLFGLTSNHIGYGWGTVLPKKVFNPITLRNYRGDLKAVQIIPEPLAEQKKKGYNAVHIKVVKETSKTLDMYEILSNVQVKGYVFYIQVEEYQNPTFSLITAAEKDVVLSSKLLKKANGKKQYAIFSKEAGLLIVKK